MREEAAQVLAELWE